MSSDPSNATICSGRHCQLNPVSVFVMIYSVNTNKDSNVVIEHKGGHCNNVIEATIMIISIRLESNHCLPFSLTLIG